MRPIHEKIQEAAKAKGMSQADVARAIPEVAPSLVGHWFTGRRKPLVDNLRRLADVLSVSAGWLIEDDPEYAKDGMERELLRRFRDLSPAQREAVLAIAATMAPQD